MKKTILFVVAALTSVTMWAGANDLLWDYMETAPSANPDNGLTYDSKVNDAAGTKNGLKGIKMNGSGYAYFTKAAVAGKLKLTFGPRDGANKTSLEVFTWAGDTPAAETSIGATGEQTESGTQIIDLTAEQTNIYIKRKLSVETVLQKIQFIEEVPRSFVDFEMIMCNMAEEYDFTTLPEGVTASGTFNTDQHGYRGFTIKVPVDGTVKFTIGDCQYGNQPVPVKNSNNEVIATLSYPAAGCYSPNATDKVFTYIYLGEADTLTFGPIQYCNYFKAEATEIMPCQVIFKDQNGTELGRVDTYEGAALEEIPYTADDLPAVAEGCVFRGWYYAGGKRAQVGDAITGNTTIQAKVTPVETAVIGTIQTYDFASSIFYPEDHETVEANGGSYYNNHGWYFNADGNIQFQVAGNAVVVVTLCKYSETGEVILKNGEEEVGRTSVEKNVTEDGTEYSYQYSGAATTLTLSWTAKQYIHKIVVYNVLDFLEKDEYGYFEVPSGDAASFIMALTMAQPGDKIFLPNGEYDLGETCLTSVTKNNISIIGQSMESVIIKNTPVAPGIGATATLRINKNVSGTYLQDLTLFCAYDYYKNDDGVGVALQDQGTQTICKNVKLLGYQDTYYSNLQGAVKYFETSEIHGTVDFICGDGSVYFYGTEMVCEKRKKDGGGSDAVTASNAAENDKGYVFEHCTIRYAEAMEGAKPIVSLGRSWNNKPKTVFLNTFLDDSNGELVLVKEASAQKDKIQRWTLGGMNVLPELFGEFNSVNSEGNVISPASNNVTFVLGSNEKQMETILTAEQAATYTMEYTLGSWAATAKADATQAIADKANIEPEAIYLVEISGTPYLKKGSELIEGGYSPEGDYSLRKANARGGFGWAAGEEPEEQAIENVINNNNKSGWQKVLRDGQMILIRDNQEYNVLGGLVK